MASRILTRMALRQTIQPTFRRTFANSSKRLETVVAAPAATALPAKRPVGAFRGGLFGFLLGATASGFGMYYYVLGEYRVSNELLTEDIYNLQATVQRIESYVRVLEDKVETATKKK